MTMTDEEILSAAGRLRAAKRRVVAKTCDACGMPFEGMAQRRYCSSACRMRAARRRNADAAVPRAGVETPSHAEEPIPILAWTDETEAPPAPRGADEPLLAYLERMSAYPTGGRVFGEGSVELLRQAREERTAQLERAIEGEPGRDRPKGGTVDDSHVVDGLRAPVAGGGSASRGAAAEPPRGKDEPIADYFERIGRAMTSGRPLDDDSVDVLRQERERRDEELDRRVRS